MTALCAPALPALGERVLLRDGSAVLVREVRPSDAALLADGFARLSEQSRRFRFLTAKRELTPRDLRYLTDVDHVDHDAIGAVSEADGRGVGVARYVRARCDHRSAEVAVTVIDDWQHRGLGTHLLARLTARARCAGIHSFTALVAADNEAMIAMLRDGKAGVELAHVEADSLEYEVSLAPFAASLDRALSARL